MDILEVMEGLLGVALDEEDKDCLCRLTPQGLAKLNFDLTRGVSVSQTMQVFRKVHRASLEWRQRALHRLPPEARTFVLSLSRPSSPSSSPKPSALTSSTPGTPTSNSESDTQPADVVSLESLVFLDACCQCGVFSQLQNVVLSSPPPLSETPSSSSSSTSANGGFDLHDCADGYFYNRLEFDAAELSNLTSPMGSAEASLPPSCPRRLTPTSCPEDLTILSVAVSVHEELRLQWSPIACWFDLAKPLAVAANGCALSRPVPITVSADSAARLIAEARKCRESPPPPVSSPRRVGSESPKAMMARLQRLKMAQKQPPPKACLDGEGANIGMGPPPTLQLSPTIPLPNGRKKVTFCLPIVGSGSDEELDAPSSCVSSRSVRSVEGISSDDEMMPPVTEPVANGPRVQSTALPAISTLRKALPHLKMAPLKSPTLGPTNSLKFEDLISDDDANSPTDESNQESPTAASVPSSSGPPPHLSFARSNSFWHRQLFLHHQGGVAGLGAAVGGFSSPILRCAATSAGTHP